MVNPDRDRADYLGSKHLLAMMGVVVAACFGPAQAAVAGQPYSQAEIRRVITEDELKIAEIRSQEIAQLKLTLSRRIPQERQADLYLRLAEIYIEAYRAEFLLEGRAHEKRLELAQDDKTIDRSRSKPYLRLAIQACQEILDLGIRYERMDQVYYFLAYNHSELEEQGKAQENYSKIIQKFPRSSFAVEAYKELGEAAFEARDYRSAESYFEKVLEFSTQAPGFSTQLPRVRHRLAWCYYRQKQYARAVAEMKEAIRLATGGKEKLLSVREEALRDLAIFMTETGNVEDAIDYFKRTAGDAAYYSKVLETLGRQYERNVEPQKAVQVYESLLKTNPDAEAAFRFRVKLVDLDLRKGLYDRALQRFMGKKLYAEGEVDTETSWQNLRAMIRRTATENHEKYRKNSDRRALELAERFYEAYSDPLLAMADSRKETPEIQMYLADVKRELGKSKEASELYKKVIAGGDSRYSKEAAALWTASLADAIKKDNTQKSGDKLRTEPSALELDFVKAADDLAGLVPDTIEARESEMRAAQVLAGYSGVREEAIARLRGIMKRYPQTGQAITAARLWIQIYTDRLADAERLDKVGEQAQRAASELEDQFESILDYDDVMAYDKKTGSKIRTRVAELRARLSVMEIAFAEKNGDLKKAARGYEQFAEKSPAKDVASKAYENAVASYLKLNDIESADRVLGTWQKKFPDSQGAIQAMRNSATLLFVQGKFEGSAAVLERLGILSKDADAVESAIRILGAVGEDERRDALAARYAKTFPNAQGRARVALALARAHESGKRDALAVQSYRECLGFSGAGEEVECLYRLGMLYKRIGAGEDAILMIRKAGSSAAKGTAAFFVSQARWEIARLTDAQINAAQDKAEKLTLQNLAQQLPKRLQDFEVLQKAISPVLDIGGPYSVPASYRLGRAAVELADEIERVAPQDKSVGQAAGALRAKAAQIYKQAVSKAQENEWLSPEMPRVMGELSFLEKSIRAQGAKPVFRWMDPRDSERRISIDKIRESLEKNGKDGASWTRYGTWLALDEGNLELAAIALERAFSLEAKNPAVLNNLALLKGLQFGFEDAYGALQMNAYLKQAQSVSDAGIRARENRAQLLNHYGIFLPAKRLFEQVLVKAYSSESEDGLATSLQGLGNPTLARSAFVRAQLGGLDSDRFSQTFQEAAATSIERPELCLDKLDDMESPDGTFEKIAAELLERHCKVWVEQKRKRPAKAPEEEET